MLIPSPRHSPADLELWAGLEEADRLRYRLGRVAEKADRSLAAIRDFLAAGPAAGWTSWGKDSVVLGHLLSRAAPDVPLVHLRPTNHNPDCDAVRDEYFARRPGRRASYSEVPVDYGAIHAAGHDDGTQDRLTDRAWDAAIRRAGKPHGGRHVTGIRAAESGGRLLRMKIWGLNSPNGCAPLGWWSAPDVFAFLAHHDLPVHPAYAMLGGGRWPRERLRVAEIGDTHGKGSGRREWEIEYYSDMLRRLEAGRMTC